MGNIKDKIKDERRKTYKNIILNSLIDSILPTFILTIMCSTSAFLIKYFLMTYKAYWGLFIVSIKLLINMIPIIFISMLVIYLVLFVFVIIDDIIKFKKVNK